MKPTQLLDNILLMIRTFNDDPIKLQKLYDFISNELYQKAELLPDSIPVPAPYKALVKDIADSLSANLVCYINPDTIENINIPQSVLDTMIFEEKEDEEEDEDDDDNDDVNETEETSEEEDSFYADIKRIRREWQHNITIEPLDSHESFSIMEQFVNSLPDGKMYKKLSAAISGRKPFSHFNNIIHQSDEREAWFTFRQKWLENYVAEILAEKLWNNKAGN